MNSGGAGRGTTETHEPEFIEADERAGVSFACAYRYSKDNWQPANAAAFADGLLAELRKRRPAERKEGPYR